MFCNFLAMLPKTFHFHRRPYNIIKTEKFNYFLGIYKETTPIVLVTVLAEIVVGLELLRVQQLLGLFLGLLIILPGLLENRGNIASNLAQRLGTAVHLGAIGWDLGFNDELKVNFIATLLMSATLSLTLTGVAYLYVVLFNVPHISIFGFLFVTLTMSLGIGSILTIITIFVVLLSHRFGFDPDNVTIPIIATIGDILTVGALYFVLNFMLLLDKSIPIFQ